MKKLLHIFLASLLLLSTFMLPAAAAQTNPVKVSGETVIEFENFYDNYVTENENASGGKLLYTSWGEGKDPIKEDIVLEITLNVETEGYYNTEYSAASRKNNAFLSMVTLSVDETPIGNNNAVGTPVADGFMDAGDFAVYRYSGTPVYLTSGEHTVKATVEVTQDERVKFALDYLKLVPNEADQIGNEKTTFEFENYSGSFVTENENASGGKLVYTTWGTNTPTYSISIPVNVLNSGYYSAEYAVTKHPDKVGTSDIVLKIDDEVIGDNKHTTAGTDISNGNTYFDSNFPMYRYNSSGIYLEKGNHVITLEVATTADNVVKFGADYISIMPFTGFELPAGGAKFEFEDFSEKYVIENENASGGKLLSTDWGSDETFQVEIPINVAENGLYDMTYAIAQHPNSIGTSDVEILVDEVAVGNNLPGSGEDISEDGTYLKDIFPMYLYTQEIYLDKGVHLVTLDVKTSVNNVVKFAADYISIVRDTADKALIGNGSVRAIANYDTPVTGTAVAALYKGKELVGAATQSVADTYYVEVEVPAEIKPDLVKVFLWEDMENIVPLAKGKEITDIRYEQTDVFLLGDSVCVAYNIGSFPQQGWGYYMQEQFIEQASVKNKAVGGTSTKTYQSQGYWENAIGEIGENDFVLINFGLNDFYDISETGKGTTITEYKENLTMFCEEIMKKGATPILVTPLPECKKGNLPALAERAEAMKEVGSTLGVTVIDMNTTLVKDWMTDTATDTVTDEKISEAFDQYYLSRAAYTRLEEEYGIEIAQEKWDALGSSNPDRTHINVDGAKYFADTLAGLLKETDLRLKDYIK